MLGPYGNRFLLHVAPAKLDALGPRCGARPGSEKSRCLGMDALTLEAEDRADPVVPEPWHPTWKREQTFPWS